MSARNCFLTLLCLCLLLFAWQARAEEARPMTQEARPMVQEARPLAEDPVTEKRMLAIADELRCLVCQNETIAASNADLARDLRREIRSMIGAGKSDTEILGFMVERYGDFVLYRPPFKATTWLLWLLPPLFLLLGLVGARLYLIHRSRRLSAAAALPAETIRRAQHLLADELPADSSTPVTP